MNGSKKGFLTNQSRMHRQETLILGFHFGIWLPMTYGQSALSVVMCGESEPKNEWRWCSKPWQRGRGQRSTLLSQTHPDNSVVIALAKQCSMLIVTRYWRKQNCDVVHWCIQVNERMICISNLGNWAPHSSTRVVPCLRHDATQSQALAPFRAWDRFEGHIPTYIAREHLSQKWPTKSGQHLDAYTIDQVHKAQEVFESF